MIITIDTSKDSLADIRRAIALLQQIASDGVYLSSGYLSVNPNSNQGYVNPFTSPLPSSQNNLQMLSHSNQLNQSNVSAQSSSSAADGFAAMFGDNSPVYSQPPSSAQQSPSASSPYSQSSQGLPLPSIIGLPTPNRKSDGDGAIPPKRNVYEFDTY